VRIICGGEGAGVMGGRRERKRGRVGVKVLSGKREK